ncbi:Iron-dependent extradiol dioxygenase [Paraburkholderia domus]|jgi:Lactoylglutathione lyase and related lyases|uniref:Iron-dependent extradiol dioxygenase n=1 Tax=Paraburkholderia domus TaxID=2793075 RepID=A0A9N8MQX6_9BURK|nr:VOC family protein [Paraburkholderia domus]MBK5048774.1 VOC family protein [Burkholderia sp. R-70006]MBK5061516.1 VOC family protein [Burkholderia sp. R-70199]MBK5086558.1 VOC family protein [Burkholderia sp. R-69927]MBK5120163.1 VOC family protein [Burkholderia sp. R-69980]MBK5165605.1 VOC family protein [Burkholderia sp. R-70211]MBK5180120.1 VOC family protein [Burkholderia sp. R-69749]
MIDVRALGYVVVQSADVGTWRGYAENVLGMQAQDATDGALYVKMDERDFRYLIVPSDADRYFASGWELADAAAFDDAIRTLEQAGVEPIRASAQEAALRRVQAMVWCTDPSGNRHEFFWGVRADFRRFVSPLGVSGFVTGAMGLGHAVLPAPQFDATDAFLRDVLGFELSDIFRVRFTDDPAEPEKRIHFLHCKNARHHSLAIMDLPVPSGCIHVMAEVDSMDEVGRALDRVASQGVKLSATLGRHCNDHMISFYMKTPGGFDLEYGYGGLTVDWAQHSVYEATRVSLWGHDFSVGFR